MTAIPQEGTSSNRYLILGRLAGGGMADIFLARSSSDAGVDRYVVLKRVLAERSKDPHFATMFLDEARLASQLQHPNIAQVHDIGKLGGSYFYTMEYVHGEDLRHVLMRLFALRRPFPLPLVLHIAIGALAGLHHAHTRTTRDGKPLGVVHRDVSPSNVMVSYEGIIKMLDFGVAKATQHSAESRSGTIKGKIAYLSPEQCQGTAIDRRSDIYSLGIVMHEMLTGRRLYKRDTDFAMMMAIVQEQVAPPSVQRPDVSPELDHLVLTALEKDPNKRFATAADMIEAIESLAAREHHVMSGTALGKFMRDLFGDRPEPWLEIQAREEETKAITVTGESVAGLDPLAGAVPISMAATPSGGHLVADNMSSGEVMIQQQLDQARPIGRPDDRGSDSMPRATPVPQLQPQAPQLPQAYPIHRPDTDGPTADARIQRPPNPTPSMPARGPLAAITTVGVAPPPMISSHSSSQTGMPAYPTAPPEMMAEYRSQTNAPVLVVPLLRRRSFVIVASAAFVVVVIVLVMTLFGGREQAVGAKGSDVLAGSGSDGVIAAVTIDAPVAIPETPLDAEAEAAHADAMVEVPADAAIAVAHADAAVAVAHADARVAHVAVDAGAPSPPSLAALVAAGSFTEVSDRCTATPPATAADRARCGIAACNLKQKAAALNYYNATAGASQALIERACKDKNIVLKAPKVVVPPKNPCDDKKFREENPLKCQ